MLLHWWSPPSWSQWQTKRLSCQHCFQEGEPTCTLHYTLVHSTKKQAAKRTGKARIHQDSDENDGGTIFARWGANLK